MRLLFAATSYPSSEQDWKGLFIQRLVEALAQRPNVDLQLWLPPGRRPDGSAYAATADDAIWLQRLMDDGGVAHLLRNRKLHGLATACQLLYRLRRAYRRSDCHLYHINWLQNALVLPDDGKPALISVLGSDLQLLKLPGMRVLLRRAMRNRHVILCPNADWMEAPLAQAFGDVASIRVAPFGIDTSWYTVERRPDNQPRRWIAVTRLTSSKLGTLFEWSAPHFKNAGRELHLFGPMQESIAVPDWIHYHGSATPEQLCRDWFPRAYGLVTLSRHAEGRPQVMLEAMAAGLPILASQLPAHADIIEHAVTGWLCHDPAGFAEGIAVIEDPIRNVDIGRHAHDWARNRIGDWNDCAARYAIHYRGLLESSAR
ncbi:glycosyltransferase family 4 protein [Lysobacter sp. M2-1]|uniref:glycosyltransferase family 4 protein n=1 Tax=Lysobacter sp. M2-1 TaxID=2916839 RepID=UPI001F59A364|nr:glycosyltransferase family 4 protein [Lysobacter sp. M2-1]